MAPNDIYPYLKTALRLTGQTTASFARSVVKPDGTVGVTPPLVVLVAQGRGKSTWLREHIEAVITDAQARWPEFFQPLPQTGS